MQLTRFTTVLLSLIVFSSCKKEKPAPPSIPEQEETVPRIAVRLNADYVSATKIDSATLVWENGTQVQETLMQLSNDTLFAETKNLTKGAGRLTIQIFSSVKLRQQSLQWERRTDVILKEKQSVNWKAPTNYDDANWNPRVILKDYFSSLVAVVALRPTDPYFSLKNVPFGYKIELDRNYTRIPGGAEIVAGGTWKCNTVCTDAKGNIENRDFFRSLATQVIGREWKMVETGIGFFGPNNTSGPTLYFNHY